MLRWRNQVAEKTGRRAGGGQNGSGCALVEPMEGRVLMAAHGGWIEVESFQLGSHLSGTLSHTAPDTYQIISAGR